MARIAILSDIHGNLSAFEAVLADLRMTAPDLVLHGGDLADGGRAPCEIVDRIREMGWPGVLGNTDEMLFRPEALDSFSAGKPALANLFNLVREIASITREELGTERLEWLSSLPLVQVIDNVTLLHASPNSVWQAPGADADADTFNKVYGAIESNVAVFGHIHQPFVRTLKGKTLVNSGSVGLPYDGDPRAAYALIDGNKAQIRRVEYDVNREVAAVQAKDGSSNRWIARMLATARPQMPES